MQAVKIMEKKASEGKVKLNDNLPPKTHLTSFNPVVVVATDNDLLSCYDSDGIAGDKSQFSCDDSQIQLHLFEERQVSLASSPNFLSHDEEITAGTVEQLWRTCEATDFEEWGLERSIAELPAEDEAPSQEEINNAIRELEGVRWAYVLVVERLFRSVLKTEHRRKQVRAIVGLQSGERLRAEKVGETRCGHLSC